MLQARRFSMNTYPPDDIVEDILVRLPSKSLVRFNCVSKKWISLIKDPRFARANLHHPHIHRDYTIVFNSVWGLNMIDGSVIQKVIDDDSVDWITGRTNKSTEDYNALDVPVRGIHLAPLNGLFSPRCCCDGILCGTFVHPGGSKNQDLMLWNPTINEYKILPPPGVNLDDFTTGFGYDSSLDDYKIVLFPNQIGPMVKVFTVKSNSWRTICSNFSYNISEALYWQAVKANGKLYSLYSKDRREIIIEFDIEAETFSEVSIPSGLYANHISTSDDCLYLCGETKSEDNLPCDDELWVMKEKTWVKLHSFFMNRISKPLCFTREEVLVTYNKTTFTLRIYDPKLDVYKKLKTLPFYFDYEVYAYSFTLISPLRQ